MRQCISIGKVLVVSKGVSQDGGPIAGILLAGGLGRRMGGGDKPLNMLGGRPILDFAIERAKPQVDALVLNVNGDVRRFEGYDLPLVSDVIADYAGPLAGILTGMEWSAKNIPAARWLVSFATDAPFFPHNLVEKLVLKRDTEHARIVCASSHGRTHPVFALWPIELAPELRHAMQVEDIRKIDRWTARYVVTSAEFSATDGIDPFFNINRPDDLAVAAEWVEKQREEASLHDV